MLITLIDIFTIVGFIPHGIPLENLETFDDRPILDGILAYGKFLVTFSKTFGPINITERVTFMLYWLSKYVFFSPTLKVSGDHANLALNLARRKMLSFGPLVLAVLYRIWSILDLASMDGSLLPLLSLQSSS